MQKLVQNIILNIISESFPSSPLGRRRSSAEEVLSLIYFVLESGMTWRHLMRVQTKYDFRTVHNFFRKWSKAKVFERAYISMLSLSRRRRRRGSYHCIDTSFVKNILGRDCVGRNPTDRGRNATKMSVIVDETGIPVSLSYYPANVHDVRTVTKSLENLMVDVPKSTPIYADKGYDSKAVRRTFQRFGYIDRVGKRRHRVHRVVNSRVVGIPRVVLRSGLGFVTCAMLAIS